MRKSIIGHAAAVITPPIDQDWLNLASLATVEVTSEAADHPIESAFNFGEGPGWRAGEGGAQTIRLRFDQPQHVRRIWLRFVETESDRTQELTLRWSGDPASSLREIVRQQWNFSPASSPAEMEDYQVDLRGVSVLELNIKPDLNDSHAVATLGEWRVA